MSQLLAASPLLFGLLIGALIPILMVVRCAQTYQAVNKDLKIYVFKACLSLGVWGGLSLFLIIFLSGYMMGLAHTPNPGTTNDRSLIFTFWGLEFVYALVGSLFILWTGRREDA